MNPWRRTVTMLLAALAAAVALGLPADVSKERTARAAAPGAPQVTHSGPECFAGATADQVSKGRD
jgi:hypothetical protein